MAAADPGAGTGAEGPAPAATSGPTVTAFSPPRPWGGGGRMLVASTGPGAGALRASPGGACRGGCAAARCGGMSIHANDAISATRNAQ